MSGLAGKTAVITGAARGVGRACARLFAEQGADLVLVDVAADLPGVPYPMGTASQLEHTAQVCRQLGGTVLVCKADIRDDAAVHAVADGAVGRFGRIDVVVNNAGIAAPSGQPVHRTSPGDWNLMLDVNLSGAWRMINAVGGIMAAQRSGSIVNVSSTAGLVGYRHFAGYVAAQHGLVGLTKAAALDLAPLGVRVNALCPGSIRDAESVEGVMLAQIA